jgi:hypothetical protein
MSAARSPARRGRPVRLRARSRGPKHIAQLGWTLSASNPATALLPARGQPGPAVNSFQSRAGISAATCPGPHVERLSNKPRLPCLKGPWHARVHHQDGAWRCRMIRTAAGRRATRRSQPAAPAGHERFPGDSRSRVTGPLEPSWGLLPSWSCEFDSRHPLHIIAPTQGPL